MPIPAQAYYRHTMASMPTRSCSPLSRKPRIEVTDTGIFRIARKPSGVANARCPGRNALHDPGAERGARPSGQFHGTPGAAPDQTETEHGRRRGIQFRSRLTSRCCTPAGRVKVPRKPERRMGWICSCARCRSRARRMHSNAVIRTAGPAMCRGGKASLCRRIDASRLRRHSIRHDRPEVPYGMPEPRSRCHGEARTVRRRLPAKR